MSEPWDYNKTQSVTFKGAVSQGSHSWTHALPSGDITPRLLPWAPVLPLDKCRPLLGLLNQVTTLSHVWAARPTSLSPRSTAAAEAQHIVHPVFACKYWWLFFPIVYLYSWGCCVLLGWSQSAPWIISFAVWITSRKDGAKAANGAVRRLRKWQCRIHNYSLWWHSWQCR